MMQTYVIYFGVLFASWILALVAERSGSKKPVWLLVIIMSLVSGLRAPSVGLDTQMYTINFELLGDGHFGSVYGIEETFKYICYYIMKINNDPVFVFMVFSFITNSLIIFRLWDLKNLSSFCISVPCYYMAFFMLSLNVSRQFIAIAIVFYATRYLAKNKYILYIVGVLIAMLFHQSACFALALFAVEIFKWKDFSLNRKITFLCVIAISPVAFYFVSSRILRYERYLAESTVDIGIMIILKFVFLLATVLFVFLFRGNGNELQRKMRLDNTCRNSVILIVSSYFIGLTLAFSSYFFEILNRASWYFYIFEGAYMGMLVKTKRDIKIIYIVYIAIIIGWGFLTTILDNSQGTVPYGFFWQ